MKNENDFDIDIEDEDIDMTVIRIIGDIIELIIKYQ